MNQGGNYWTLFTPGIWKVLHAFLQPMKAPEDAVAAMSAILQAVAEGEVTPSEASELAKLVDTFVKVLEANELAQRLTAVERQLAA